MNTTTLGTNGIARHVIHRRNDGTACFIYDEDYLVYLDCLQEAAARHRCAVHCYVLMPDRAQLLVTPEAEHGLPVMMRSLAGRYAEYMHYIYQHHGAFWEQGTRVSPVGGEQDVLACHRAVEAAPEQACLAASASDYRWSSYHHHARGREDAVVSDHPSYLRLGATPMERQAAYRRAFREGVAAGSLKQEIARLAREARNGGTGYPLMAGHAAA